MKLNKLVITNFGPYRGSEEFDLRTTPEDPLVLFGGKNGAGKTTLFQSVQIGLHGKSALGQRTSQQEYEATVRNKLHDGPDGKAEEASVRLEFEYGNFGERESYVVHRSWRDRGKSIAESLTVERNGEELSDLDADQWEDFLKELIPPGVSQLFFFDGEKVQELAAAIEDDSVFEDSLLSLLGLDLVERLEADLSIYLSNKLDDGDKEGLKKKVEEFNERQSGLEEELDEIEHEIAETMDQRSQLNREISQKEDELAQEGGAFAERRSELKEQRATLESEIESINEDLREIVKDSFPFTLVPDLCRSVETRLREETKARDRAAARDEVVEEIDSVQTEESEQLRDGLDVSEDDSQELLSRLRSTLVGRLGEDEPDQKLADSFSEQQRQQMYQIVEHALNEVPEQTEELTTKLEQKSRELNDIEQQIGRAPEQATISPILDKINELTEDRGRLSEKIERLDKRREEVEQELTWVETEKERAIDKKVQSDDVSERAGLAKQTREAVKEYRDKLATRKLERLEDTLTEKYLTLSNKSNFYSQVHIDAAELSVWIETKNGDRKNQSQLSAGERQIFATAMLWALAEISDRPLPFIIDTPLGRLDHDHRENLVENFFPEASHQVIVLSTDTEITDEYYDYLSDYTSAKYNLQYDEDEGKTDVLRGYFGEQTSEEQPDHEASNLELGSTEDDEQMKLEEQYNE